MIMLLILAACELRPMDPERPCLEVGYAIASRTFQCTDDGDLANGRFDRFREEFECIEYDLEKIERKRPFTPEKDLFHCAFQIRTLECSDVKQRGDDLLSWMDVSPACAMVVIPRKGELPDPVAPDTGVEPVDLEGECPYAQTSESATFSVFNQGGGERSLFWLHPDSCEEIFYWTLAPNELFVQQSFVGDLWLVRDESNGNVVRTFRAADGLMVEL